VPDAEFARGETRGKAAGAGSGAGHPGAPEGIVAVCKAPGPTSHDVVQQVRRVSGQRRVGHCGTLDPLATGVLVLCLGRYTRLASLVSDADKEYEVLLRLGATSDTYDACGEIRPGPAGVGAPSAAAVTAAAARLCGSLMQAPPPFSAIKVGGVRSYRLARRGRPVDLPARPVLVHRLEVLGYRFPALRLLVSCSKGTYVRALAHDLGQSLGCGAYVEELRRTRVGAVTLDDAVSVQQLAEAAARQRVADLLLPLARVLPHLQRVRLDTAELGRFAAGGAVRCSRPLAAPGTCLVEDARGRFWGIGEAVAETGLLRPRRVVEPCVPEFGEGDDPG